jgi:transcription elongation factor Elf1
MKLKYETAEIEDIIEDKFGYDICFSCPHCNYEDSVKVKSYDQYCELIKCNDCNEEFWVGG